MVKFVSPSDKAVKSVLIYKNRLFGRKIFFAFVFSLISTLVLGLINYFINNNYTAVSLFSDYLFTGFVLLTVLLLCVSVLITFRPILKKELNENGHYDIEVSEKGVNVVFLDNVQVFVPKAQINSVLDFNDYFVIRCFSNKDEIVCEKSCLNEGDLNLFEQIFLNDYGVSKIKSCKEDKLTEFIVNGRKDSVVLTLLQSLFSLVLIFPCMWFTLAVLTEFLPNLLPTIVNMIAGFENWLKLLCGAVVVPLGLILTVLAAASSLTVFFLPFLLLTGSVCVMVLRIKNRRNLLGTVACLAVFVFSLSGIIQLVIKVIWML